MTISPNRFMIAGVVVMRRHVENHTHFVDSSEVLPYCSPCESVCRNMTGGQQRLLYGAQSMAMSVVISLGSIIAISSDLFIPTLIST